MDRYIAIEGMESTPGEIGGESNAAFDLTDPVEETMV